MTSQTCRCGCGRVLTRSQVRRNKSGYASRGCCGRHLGNVNKPDVRARAQERSTATKRRHIVASIRARIAERFPGQTTFTERQMVELACDVRKTGYRSGWGACWSRWERFTGRKAAA